MHDGLKIDVMMIVIACWMLQRTDGVVDGASETGSSAIENCPESAGRRRAFFFGAAVQVQQGRPTNRPAGKIYGARRARKRSIQQHTEY